MLSISEAQQHLKSAATKLEIKTCSVSVTCAVELIHNSSFVSHGFYPLLSACSPATLTCFFQIGDRVMAFVNYNAWAEVVCTPVEFVYKLPDEMTFAEAAAFSLNFVAAYMMLFEVANLREGMSVLVHSAGGGVVSSFPL